MRDDREVMIYAAIASGCLWLAFVHSAAWLAPGLYCLLMTINAIVGGPHG